MKNAPNSATFNKITVAAKKGVRRRGVGGRPSRGAKPSSRELPKGLFSDFPHLVWMTDARGRCIYINETFADFTGASPDSFLEESWTRFLHPHDVVETTVSWLSSVRQHASHQAQYRIKRHDNVYRWMLARAVPVMDASGQVTHWVGTNTDVHELRERWHGLENSGLSEQELMATWAHDIRAPLMIARLKAETTLLHRDDPKCVAENMNALMQDVDRIENMIKDLLDAKSDRARDLSVAAYPPTDLREVLSTSVQRLLTLYPERLSVSMTQDSLLGSWNAIALQRALETLVGNAAKYGHLGTPVNVSLASSRSRATISVHNLGPTLSSEAQRLIFGPYFRMARQPGPPDHEGWGLGLPMVKRIAEEHGAFVQVESSDSAGTTFRIVLPLVDMTY